jgi:hypothetical protein
MRMGSTRNFGELRQGEVHAGVKVCIWPVQTDLGGRRRMLISLGIVRSL